jgi:sugar phosphate isomerase/epimerase
VNRSNSPAGLGDAVTVHDLQNIPGLKAFILERQRDVELADFIPAAALAGDWRSIAEVAAAELEGHTGRLGVHGLFMGFAIDTYDPDVPKIVKQRLDAALDACIVASRKRGGARMVVHSPFTTWRWYNRLTEPGRGEAIVERVHLCLADAVKKTEDSGITIVIEYIEDKDPAERVALASSFASPAVRVSLDTGHAHYAYGATRAPPVDVVVRAAAGMLAHVHLQDTDAFADRHWAIGEGSISWHAVFEALGELDEMRRLIIELKNARDIQPSAARLAALGLAV